MDLKQQLHDIIQQLNGKHSKLEFKIKEHVQLYQAIKHNWTCSDPPKNFIEECYVFLTGESPYCARGNRQTFEYFRTGFKSCARRCECAVEKYTNSMLKNHGVTSPMKNADIRQRAVDTWIEKYSVSELGLINVDKKRENCMNKWGAPTPLESEVIQAKIAQTNQTKLGVRKPFQNAEIRDKIQQQWQQSNSNGQKTYVKTKQDGYKYRLKYAEGNFSDPDKILQDPEKLTQHLRNYSRSELAQLLNCSLGLIDARVNEFDLTEFQNVNSYYEILIANYLDQMQVQYEVNTRKVIAPLELDFFVPSHNLAIEFCGLRWHGEMAGRGKDYHANKLAACTKLGIRLIQIFQDEWDSNSRIVKDILKGLLSKPENKLYARQCTVKEIDSVQSNDFLKQNHLQGMGNGSKIHLGLFFQEQLVSVMTFSTAKTQWELKRYAVKCGYSIVGGASKLFTFFTRKYQPAEVFSYCDLRYFIGNVYRALNFDYVYTTKPGYSYCKGIKRFNRLQFTKQRLIQKGHDANLTEWQIMQNLGYDKIWDCGHSKWIWKPKHKD
jgi:hypothetical protein